MYTTKRIDDYRVAVEADGMQFTLYANKDVFIDNGSFEQLSNVAAIAPTIKQLNDRGYFGSIPASMGRCVLTPDFHKGGTIPIGTVVEAHGFVSPAMVGSDIGCGMRLLTTDITVDEYARLGDELDKKLRYIFFEGGRNIAMSAHQRQGMFRHGIQGLLEEKNAGDGIWRHWHQDQQERDIMRTHLLGCLPTDGIYDLDDFIRGSGAEFTRDDQIGSIGGGNHFCELQHVEEIYDGGTARAWGIKPKTIAIMVHTGSVGIGHIIGKVFSDRAKKRYPNDMKHDHPFYLLPADDVDGLAYRSAMGNAANFAFANRLFLGLMVVRAFSECLGREIETNLVYDAPHNLVWSKHGRHIHRKGACPAPGPSDDADFPSGHPVIIPGSMGSSSFILRGNGSEESLCSACHGAGRLAPRQSARRAEIAEFEKLRVVTKIDPKMMRRDIVDEYNKALLEEAPSMYKNPLPVIETVVGAGIASKVARVWPLMTIKGL